VMLPAKERMLRKLKTFILDSNGLE
jgi:hypothetical protein